MAAREALDIIGRRYPATHFIISSLANFSCCYVESATLAIFLLHLELLLSPLELGRGTHSTNKKQEKGKRQLLVGPRARGKYW
jgi:hypothetical protein